ncbi:MAG: hypothetical protein ACI9BW_004549, partial [Gammaproteobacteria bacterium]
MDSAFVHLLSPNLSLHAKFQTTRASHENMAKEIDMNMNNRVKTLI